MIPGKIRVATDGSDGAVRAVPRAALRLDVSQGIIAAIPVGRAARRRTSDA